MACFLGSLVAMAGVAGLYLQGGMAWWLAVPLMAFAVSILHELEHDLIHDLYFRSRPWIQNLMFCVIWFGKLSLNPWYRRGIHLKHHRDSGQSTDIEERLIGLGLPFGLLRMFVAIHPLGGMLLFRRIKREAPDFQPLRLALLSLPTYTLFNVISVSFMGYVCVQQGWTYQHDPFRLLPAWGWPWARDLTVLLVVPNVLRQACLVLMSSHSHYYGDIPERDIFFQNQILSHWMLFPFQLFCFNFGATHVIHHYVMHQPFYLRQMVARAALAEMRRQGTRTNDLRTVVRANRWGGETTTAVGRIPDAPLEGCMPLQVADQQQPSGVGGRSDQDLPVTLSQGLAPLPVRPPIVPPRRHRRATPPNPGTLTDRGREERPRRGLANPLITPFANDTSTSHPPGACDD